MLLRTDRDSFGLGILAVIVAVGFAGCDGGGDNGGDDGGDDGTADAVGGGGGIAASPFGSEVGGTAGVAGVAGSGTTSGGFVSNLPATTTTDFQNTDAGDGLALRSLNIVADSLTDYTEWFGEVVNEGTQVICFPIATFTFKSGSGVVLWTDDVYADALPYMGSLTTSMPCLGPGEHGAFWTNDLSTVAPSNVASVSITFDGLITTGTKFVQTMTSTVVPDTIYQDGNHWAMSGTLSPSQTIYNVGIDAYPKSASGLLLDDLIDTNLGTITANTSWSFESGTGVEGTKPVELLVFDSFILGSSTSGYGVSSLPDVLTDPDLASALSESTAKRKAVRERRRAVRGE